VAQSCPAEGKEVQKVVLVRGAMAPRPNPTRAVSVAWLLYDFTVGVVAGGWVGRCGELGRCAAAARIKWAAFVADIYFNMAFI
jgi:hypothetical protein